MKFFIVVNSKKIKQFLIIVIAAFFSAYILYMGTLQQSVFLTQNEPMAFYKGETGKNHVALTFDLSWGDEQAEQILDVLQKEGVKHTTFFISAAWAERHPQIVERIVKEGHEIGSMGYHYRNYTDWEENKIRQDLETAENVFKKLGIKNIKYFRPPTGNFNKKILQVAHSHGYITVHYSIDSKDYTNPGTEQIIKNALSNISGGDIILLNASDSSTQTANALPSIIKGLQAKKLKSVTIDELIANSDIENEEIK